LAAVVVPLVLVLVARVAAVVVAVVLPCAWSQVLHPVGLLLSLLELAGRRELHPQLLVVQAELHRSGRMLLLLAGLALPLAWLVRLVGQVAVAQLTFLAAAVAADRGIHL
jgi:hypothetical protein